MYTQAEAKAAISRGWKWAGRFALARPIITLSLALIVALVIWKSIAIIGDWRERKAYQSDRARIVSEQPPLREQSSAAQSQAVVANAINAERTTEINDLLKRQGALLQRMHLSAERANRAGRGASDPAYIADVDELRRLCARAKALDIECNANAIRNQ